MPDTTSAPVDIRTIMRTRRLIADGGLRELREAALVNKTELAEACGVTIRTVRGWESGTLPRRDLVARLAPVIEQLAAAAAAV